MNPTTPTYLNELSEFDSWLIDHGASRIFVLLDENTEKHCWPLLLQECSTLKNAELITVEPGEGAKELEICHGIWSALLELKADRKSLIINLGGGVITDLGGFIAATFKRGIPFVNIPTTTLAQVDAALGGKTGINFKGIKNMIGTFSNAERIIIHPPFLDTLANHEWRSGIAELIKHALIGDPQLWQELSDLPTLNQSSVNSLIAQAAGVKTRTVEEDPFERGLRKTLNFGHTTGHAIEALSHKSSTPLRHGEAIALGMRIALILSTRLSGLKAATSEAILAALGRWYPELSISDYDPVELWKLMLSDKKNEGSEVLFVLLTKVGECKWGIAVSYEQWISAVRQDLDANE